MMSRMDEMFAALRAQGRCALIPYIMGGYPESLPTPDIMHALVAAGANAIELGFPFSDPAADGPVIQRAGRDAVARGVNLQQVLAHMRAFRDKDATTPVVLMGYANPIERYEHAGGDFAKDAAAAGVDAVLIVDYPPDECEAFSARLKAAGLQQIFLLAPTSTEERMEQVAQLAGGFVYYISLKGVTGSDGLDVSEVQQMLARIRQRISLPLAVGFGIRDAATARAIAKNAGADAVVLGTRLIDAMEQNPQRPMDAAVEFLREVRAALDS